MAKWLIATEILETIRLLGRRIRGVFPINYYRGEIDVFERLYKWIEKTPLELIEGKNQESVYSYLVATRIYLLRLKRSQVLFRLKIWSTSYKKEWYNNQFGKYSNN